MNALAAALPDTLATPVHNPAVTPPLIPGAVVSEPSRMRRFARRPGFIGWVAVLGIWVLMIAAATVFMFTSGSSLAGLPLALLFMIMVPVFAVFFAIWLAVTAGTPGRIRRVVAQLLPWAALAAPFIDQAMQIAVQRR